MKRTTLAFQLAPAATGTRPCADAYGQRCAETTQVGVDRSMQKTNLFGITDATALGRPPG